jgi:predicted ATPase
LSYLKKISFNWCCNINTNIYPFNLPALINTTSIDTDHNVIFFTGENGTGKSTLLETIAYKYGFNPKGGNRNRSYIDCTKDIELDSIITLSWFPKPTQGFFSELKLYLT